MNSSNFEKHGNRDDQETRRRTNKLTYNFRHFYIQECHRNQISPSNEVLRSVKQSLRSSKPLQRFSLCHTDVGYRQINVLLKCLRRNPQITEILLNHNKMNEKTVNYLIENLYFNKNVISVELFGNQLTDRLCSTFSDLLLKNHSLKRLKLGDNKLTHVGAKVISGGLAKNSSLIQLHLGGNKIGCEGLKYIVEALKSNNVLSSLGLRDNAIGKQGMKYLGELLGTEMCVVSDIQLKGNRISDEGAEILAECLAMNSSLKVLELQSNNIGRRGTTAICQKLEENSSIHALNFNGNRVGNDGGEAISVLIRKNGVITTIGLANNSIRKEGVIKICESLPFSSVTGLDLGGNNFGNLGAMALAKALGDEKIKLTSIDLRSCGIHYRGIQNIAQSLECNKTLCHLDLGSNCTRNKGAIAFSKAFAVNRTLTRLCLTDNQIYFEGGQALAIGLQKNFTLRNFSYGGQGRYANRVDSTIRRIIDAIIKENKKMFEQFLQEGEESKVLENPNSDLNVRFVDINHMMEKVGGDNMNPRNGRRDSRGRGGKFPPWFEVEDYLSNQFRRKKMKIDDLDKRLEYVFRSKLLKAENPKFQGFFFIGNILNTLRKCYPDTVDTVDEVQIVKHAYKDSKFYVHISRELVKTQIKYVGFSNQSKKLDSAKKRGPRVGRIEVHQRGQSTSSAPNQRQRDNNFRKSTEELRSLDDIRGGDNKFMTPSKQMVSRFRYEHNDRVSFSPSLIDPMTEPKVRRRNDRDFPPYRRGENIYKKSFNSVSNTNTPPQRNYEPKRFFSSNIERGRNEPNSYGRHNVRGWERNDNRGYGRESRKLFFDEGLRGKKVVKKNEVKKNKFKDKEIDFNLFESVFQESFSEDKGRKKGSAMDSFKTPPPKKRNDNEFDYRLISPPATTSKVVENKFKNASELFMNPKLIDWSFRGDEEEDFVGKNNSLSEKNDW